jgi:hypothetical protein
VEGGGGEVREENAEDAEGAEERAEAEATGDADGRGGSGMMGDAAEVVW